MIDYNLAKQLKDAGFPQKQHFNGVGRIDFYDVKGNDVTFYGNPSLSELISECKVEFRLRCYPPRNELNSTPWFVIERPNLDDMPRQDTPEEAVAKLYLQLNEKKQ